MPAALLAPLLLAQVGPFAGAAVSPGGRAVSPLPPEDLQREAIAARRRPAAAGVSAAPAAGACRAPADADPEAVRAAAQAWLAKAPAGERTAAAECLGAALVALGRFPEGNAAFLAARDAAPRGEHGSRARLGAMAGNAALASGDHAGALAALDLARSDAGAAADKPLAAQIATDRARSLVALGRDAEAAEALADARASDPASAEAWLLSATLSRRTGKLADAQRQIETAARLRREPAASPVAANPAASPAAATPAAEDFGPDIALEAGVIAMLAGNEAAARGSWRSVLAVAPNSDAAATARDYLARLGPPPAALAGAGR